MRLRPRGGRPGPALAVLPGLFGLVPGCVHAQVSTRNGAAIEVSRVAADIRIDGSLDDPGWAGVPAIDGWFETNPGDNLPAPVGCRARLAYDDAFLYAAFEFDDPDPQAIRAPLGDRDYVSSSTDYGGVILDARNDGKTAQMFLANARGIQYDAITSDATGEDSSPDFFWDAQGEITDHGWQLEMRIPFSSIRYSGSNPDQWGILLYRNRPRDFRYQYFTSRLPRESNCFICNGRPLVGLRDLPSGSHWVVAPFVTASDEALPTGELGSPLARGDATFDGGADLKLLPNPDTVLDAAINPDFSQIESDEGQITANERFAIFQPEKRPFFLESVDLFSTPFNAIYTREFTDPRWGARATGGTETAKYTVLGGRDEGGGLVILPGPLGSNFAQQDYKSWVVMSRARKDAESSFLSLLYTGREIDGGGSNRVAGPDFEWRPSSGSVLTGQFLYSLSHTPHRPDLAPEWDGRKLRGHAGELWYSWNSRHWDAFGLYDDVADGFRADNGFVPKVGYRSGHLEGGRTFRSNTGPVRRLRVFTVADASDDRNGQELSRFLGPGFGLDTKLNTFFRLEFDWEELRGDANLHKSFFLVPVLQMQPGKILNGIEFTGSFGDQVDFANDRDASGGDLTGSLELHLTDGFRLTTSYRRRWLDVDAGSAGSGRFLTAEIARVRTIYTFSARSWLRVIGEWGDVRRDPGLSPVTVEARSSDFSGSAVFAYKLNWQTVMYLGYSDARALDALDEWSPAMRQGFFKLSYAFRG